MSKGYMSKNPRDWTQVEVQNWLSITYRAYFKREIVEDDLKKFNLYNGKFLNFLKRPCQQV